VTARRIGPYELITLLGRGGMGEVHLARDTRRGREVALKMLDPRHFDDPENYVERFRREGELLRSIQHRSLPDIYEVGVSSTGEAYLAMEYLCGEPLTHWVGRSPLDTIPLLVQICGALRAIAIRGVVHRDLSPDNILVVPQGRHPVAKIIDFGIAKEVGRTTKLTEAGYFFGKLQYCSPEQVGVLPPEESIDWRSDLYSFGVVAYHVLSGELPFRADTPVQYMSAHLHARPRVLKAAGEASAFPRRLEELVARMLEKDRTKRPGSYDEVIRAFALSHAQILLAAEKGPSTPRESDTIPTEKMSSVPETKPQKKPGTPSEDEILTAGADTEEGA